VPIDLASPAELDAFASSIVVFVLGVLGLGAAFVFALARWRRFRDRAGVAERAVRGERSELLPGFAVVSGVVETDDKQSAIEIVIEERGQEYKTKQGWHVWWRETARRVTARPFYVARKSGDTVRVEPDDSVFLVDALELRERATKRTRVRAATLDPGEECTVTGVLRRGRDPRAAGAGYRDAGEALVLMPPSGERMIVSVEPLPERYRRRARVHKRAAVVIGVVFALVHAILFGGYYATILFGRVDRVTVVDADDWDTYNKGRRTPHYGLQVAPPTKSGGVVRFETQYSAYRAELEASARNAHLSVPVRYVPGTDIAQLGEAPRVHVARAILCAMAALLVTLFYGLTTFATRAWYERPKVSERVVGRL
jgi:hypothetical protein